MQVVATMNKQSEPSTSASTVGTGTNAATASGNSSSHPSSDQELRYEFDHLVERMQSPDAAAVAKALLAMSDAELRQAFRRLAKRRLPNRSRPDD